MRRGVPPSGPSVPPSGGARAGPSSVRSGAPIGGAAPVRRPAGAPGVGVPAPSRAPMPGAGAPGRAFGGVGLGAPPANRAGAGPMMRSPEAKRPGGPPAGGPAPSGGSGGSGGAAPGVLKLRMVELAGSEAPKPYKEWLMTTEITIGRGDDNVICLTSDSEASRKHCSIADGHIRDMGSFNGTFVNGYQLDKNQRVHLKAGDKVKTGASLFHVSAGSEEESRGSLFPGMSTMEIAVKLDEQRRLDALSVEELMEEEFSKIIGHEAIKKQLRRFYKKVQLDDIREANRRLQQRDGRYHMIFAGPPGTGKTSMASLVAKIMTKMKLVKSPKVVFVNNSLELLAGFSGQTAGKVDAKVEEAKGGVLFIDEAYSIVKKEGPGSGGGGDQFGREAIDTIMKHLDPPACVFIFAGYTEPMDEFLRVNEGLGRRIPFRYTFEAYSIPELVQICSVMATAKGETLGADVLPALPSLLAGLDPVALKHHNAGLINNLVSFAQIERDGRLDLDLAEENPELTCQLDWEDFQAALPKVLRMLDRGPNGPGGIHAGGGDNGMRPKVAVQAQAQP